MDDAATAALMSLFYHEMRANKRTPLAALRLAQLTIYRRPDLIEKLAAGERGKAALLNTPAPKGKTSPTKLWAAFVLSGPGN